MVLETTIYAFKMRTVALKVLLRIVPVLWRRGMSISTERLSEIPDFRHGPAAKVAHAPAPHSRQTPKGSCADLRRSKRRKGEDRAACSGYSRFFFAELALVKFEAIPSRGMVRKSSLMTSVGAGGGPNVSVRFKVPDANPTHCALLCLLLAMRTPGGLFVSRIMRFVSGARTRVSGITALGRHSEPG